MTAAPQVKPAPKTTSKIKSPRETFPAATASSSAIATDAAEVLPYLCEIDEQLFRRGFEAFADGVNDAPVGLVRDDAFDFRDVNVAAAHRLVRGGNHRVAPRS